MENNSMGVCRLLFLRNSSLTLLSNNSTVTNIEWIINSISLLIFLAALLGNVAALIVMFTPRGRTQLTNDKYLANLAFADLLRTCFIPFTVIARMKRNFIFGRSICKFLPVIQGLGVSVDVFTLVSISIERYLAICHPFVLLRVQSMQYASLSHAFFILLIWTIGLLTALPNYFMHDLCFLPTLRRLKCERSASEYFDERGYVTLIAVLYFLIPLATMFVLYTLIILKISQNDTAAAMRSVQSSTVRVKGSPNHSPLVKSRRSSERREPTTNELVLNYVRQEKRTHLASSVSKGSHDNSPTMPMCRTDRNRRKALKLLVILIAEFFVCWTPLYVYHTIGAFYKGFYGSMPSIILDITLLFSFITTSCNPITYYFMSQRYRSVLYANVTYLYHRTRDSIFIATDHRTNDPYWRSTPVDYPPKHRNEFQMR